MHIRKRCLLAAAVIMASFLATHAFADLIELDNGDRISGTVVRISGGEVVLATEYAGELRIDFTRVSDITTEQPGRITLTNGNIVTGQIESISEDHLVINSEVFQMIEVPRSLFKGLNEEPPPVAESEELIETREILEQTETNLKEAQVTIEEKENAIEKLTSGSSLWDGTVSLGTKIERGNTDESDFSADVTATRKVPREELYFRLHYDYGEKEGETDTEEAYGTAKLKVFQTDRRYLFGVFFTEYDKFKDLENRTSFYVGPGYLFIDKEKTRLLGEIGVGIVSEFTKTETGTERNFDGSLWLHAEWIQQLHEKVDLTTAVTLFPTIGDFEDFRVRLESSLRSPLRDRWFLKLSLLDEYDNKPEGVDIERNDLSLITSLEYNF
jgi:putative salt-induced outer membrane protein YdiY